MSEMLRELCVFSVFCSLCCMIAPSGGGKNTIRIAGAVILLLILLEPLGTLDMKQYSAALAMYREEEERMLSDSEELSERLNRMVIEEQCRAYIEDKAEKLSLTVTELSIQFEWDTRGFWFPVSLRGKYRGDGQQAENLTGIIAAELGIAETSQKWEKSK